MKSHLQRQGDKWDKSRYVENSLQNHSSLCGAGRRFSLPGKHNGLLCWHMLLVRIGLEANQISLYFKIILVIRKYFPIGMVNMWSCLNWTQAIYTISVLHIISTFQCIESNESCCISRRVSVSVLFLLNTCIELFFILICTNFYIFRLTNVSYGVRVHYFVWKLLWSAIG